VTERKGKEEKDLTREIFNRTQEKKTQTEGH